MEISTSEFSWNTPSESNGITRKLKVRQPSGHSVEAEAVWVGWVEAVGVWDGCQMVALNPNLTLLSKAVWAAGGSINVMDSPRPQILHV